jgi:hypothetical protein
MERAMKTGSKQEQHKEPYKKPVLRVVELSTREVLAVGCKTTSSGINAGSGPPCSAGSCAVSDSS